MCRTTHISVLVMAPLLRRKGVFGGSVASASAISWVRHSGVELCRCGSLPNWPNWAAHPAPPRSRDAACTSPLAPGRRMSSRCRYLHDIDSNRDIGRQNVHASQPSVVGNRWPPGAPGGRTGPWGPRLVELTGLPERTVLALADGRRPRGATVRRSLVALRAVANTDPLACLLDRRGIPALCGAGL
jgi:hypothetical protein